MLGWRCSASSAPSSRSALGTEVTDAGLAVLGQLSGLRWLDLKGMEVTDEFTKTIVRQLR